METKPNTSADVASDALDNQSLLMSATFASDSDILQTREGEALQPPTVQTPSLQSLSNSAGAQRTALPAGLSTRSSEELSQPRPALPTTADQPPSPGTLARLLASRKDVQKRYLENMKTKQNEMEGKLSSLKGAVTDLTGENAKLRDHQGALTNMLTYKNDLLRMWKSDDPSENTSEEASDDQSMDEDLQQLPSQVIGGFLSIPHEVLTSPDFIRQQVAAITYDEHVKMRQAEIKVTGFLLTKWHASESSEERAALEDHLTSLMDAKVSWLQSPSFKMHNRSFPWPNF